MIECEWFLVMRCPKEQVVRQSEFSFEQETSQEQAHSVMSGCPVSVEEGNVAPQFPLVRCDCFDVALIHSVRLWVQGCCVHRACTRTHAHICTRARTHTHTHMHAHSSTHITSSLSLFCSGFQWQTFPLLCVPQLSMASATSLLQQQIKTADPQHLSN
jgi:hypothetical protein